MHRRETALRLPPPARRNAVVRAETSRRAATPGKRARTASNVPREYMPPETWYEPSEEPAGDYEMIVQEAGKGFRHVITPDDVRERLSRLPAWMTSSLEYVHFAQMTRKKRRAPCYGMQWGTTIYLYPIEESLVECFCQPPKPAQKIESAMYGGQWEVTNGRWKLIWQEEGIRDFYLNNVLIHELGHLLDARNTNYVDRERYAEWFAIEHGYKASRREQFAQRAVQKLVRRRHHK